MQWLGDIAENGLKAQIRYRQCARLTAGERSNNAIKREELEIERMDNLVKLDTARQRVHPT